QMLNLSLKLPGILVSQYYSRFIQYSVATDSDPLAT
ncbi:MAG: hypothetical protein ACI909_003829, partial [Planctomycetota bacterium]